MSPKQKGPSKCSVDGCGQDVRSGGLCGTHARRLKVHGDVMADVPIGKLPMGRRGPRPDLRKPKEPCSLDGCSEPAIARGWCGTHWARWRRTGDPGPAEINPPRFRKGNLTRCRVCELFKPPEDMKPDAQRPLGVDTLCRDCSARYNWDHISDENRKRRMEALVAFRNNPEHIRTRRAQLKADRWLRANHLDEYERLVKIAYEEIGPLEVLGTQVVDEHDRYVYGKPLGEPAAG